MKEKLREDITVAWPEDIVFFGWDGGGPPMRSRRWFVTRVTTHCVPDDPLGPRHATYSELVNSALRDDVFAVSADSKEEALMKYAASGRCRAGAVWSAVPLYRRVSEDMLTERRYMLTKEDV